MNMQLEPFFEQSMDCLCIANYEGYFEKINQPLLSFWGILKRNCTQK